MELKKIQRKWAIWLGVCSGLVVTAGAVTPILISLKDKDNKDAMDSDSIITDADVQQLQLDALTKISKKIYYLRHKEGEDNLAHDDIVKQAGAFLYNVNQAVAEVQDKNGNSTLGDDQLNNVKYNAILSESRNAGIDLTGYNYIAKNQDNLVNSYVQQLEQSGLDPTTANKQGQVFAQIYASTVEQGRVELWDEFEFADRVAEAMSSQTVNGRLASAPDADTIKLNAALGFIETRLNTLLTVNENNHLTSKIVDYVDGGKYDVGSEIDDSADLTDLFNYNYDRTEGSILSRIDLSAINIDVNNLQAGDNGDYSADVNQFVTKSFSDYSDGYGATYGTNEFLPGYKLHVRIIEKDVWTDSHTCTLKLQFGVSATAPDADHNPLWAPIPEGDDSSTKGLMVINLTPNLDQIKHISQHEYYNHASQFVVIPTDKYDSANDRFFNVVDPDERIPLYKLMSQYCTEDQNQDYIIGDDHPMYVDPKDTTGISIPDMDGIQAKDGYFHENQQLKLKVTDVNTNSPSAGKHAFSIEAQWVIVDQDGLNSNDVSTFTWKYGTNEYQKIWINYYVDPNWAKTIDKATQITEGFLYMEYFNQLSNYYKNDGENYFNKYINEKVGFAAATGVVSGLLAAALAGQIAMSMLPGAQMSALGVGLTITAIALVGIMVGVESDQVVNLKKNRALWNSSITSYIKIAPFFTEIGGTVLGYYSALWDPHKDLLAKEQAAVNVTNTVAPYTEDFNTFIAEIIATLAGETGDQALINQLKEFIESDDFNSRLFFGLMFGASASVLVSFIGTASGIRFFTNMFMRLPADPASSVVVGGDNLPLVGPDLAQQGMERLAQIGMSPEALQQYQAQLESLRRPAANLNPPPDANIPQPVANVPEGAARDAVNLAADAPESPMEGTLGAVSIIPIAILLTSSLTLLLSIAGSVVEGLFPAPDSWTKYQEDVYSVHTNPAGFEAIGDEINLTVIYSTKDTTSTLADSKITWGIKNISDVSNCVQLVRLNGITTLKLLNWSSAQNATIGAYFKDDSGKDYNIEISISLAMPK